MSHPSDPYSNRSCIRPLPALLNAACAFFSLNGKHFIYLFGGYSDKPISSQLIAVDLDEEAWWFVQVSGDPVTGRMASSMVAIDKSLYIFGGRETSDR
jgi:hypothetical protein